MSGPYGPEPPAPPPVPVAPPPAGWGAPGGGAYPGRLPPRYCARCGAPIDAWTTACPRCGTRQPDPYAAGKDRVAAALLALLFGGLGFHKFYLGRVGLGVLYLLLCWTGIPSLVAWVEAITYLAKSDEAWAAEYGGPARRANGAAIGCAWILALWPVFAILSIIALIFLGGQVSQILSNTGRSLASPTPIVRGASPSPQPSPSFVVEVSPNASMDQAKIAGLLARLADHPDDTDTLIAIGDEYYFGGDYAQAGRFYDRALVTAPDNLTALLARGAASFNLGDMVAAEGTWKRVVALAPDNQEAHYDLGYLYLNLDPPDYARVAAEWERVIAIDPTTTLARTVREHLAQFAASSLIPTAAP